MKIKLKSKLGRPAVYEFVTSFMQREDEDDGEQIEFIVRRWKDDPEKKIEILVKHISEYTLYQDSGEEIENVVFTDNGVQIEPTTKQTGEQNGKSRRICSNRK